MNLDTRFIEKKSMIDKCHLQLRGDNEFTMKNQIIEYCNEGASVDMIDRYLLAYYQGVKLLNID